MVKSYKDKQIEIAEIVREACVQAAKEGFTEASLSGLCSDGAMEAAISSIQSLNLEKVLQNQDM